MILLKVDLDPVTFIMGIGNNIDQTIDNAANAFLVCIKVMCSSDNHQNLNEWINFQFKPYFQNIID